MVDLFKGLLGGVIGGTKAFSEISKEQRKDLAEKLKREAEAEVQKLYQERGFKHAEGLQESDINAQKQLQANEIKLRKDLSAEEKNAALERLGLQLDSSEKIVGQQLDTQKSIASEGNVSTEKMSDEKNKMLKQISDNEIALKDRLAQVDKKSTEAQMMKAKIAAYTESRRVLEGGGSTEEANSILETAGLPRFEDYVVSPGKPGILGFGKEEPVIGRRVVGSGENPAGATPPAAENMSTSSSAASDLEGLLAIGRKKQQPQAVPTESPAPGIIAGAAENPYGELTPSEQELAKEVEAAKEVLVRAGYKAADIAVMAKDKMVELAKSILASASRKDPGRRVPTANNEPSATGAW